MNGLLETGYAISLIILTPWILLAIAGIYMEIRDQYKQGDK